MAITAEVTVSILTSKVLVLYEFIVCRIINDTLSITEIKFCCMNDFWSKRLIVSVLIKSAFKYIQMSSAISSHHEKACRSEF